MKKFKDFETKQSDDETQSADTVVNIIANSLNRAGSSKSTGDSKSILMLIAALGLLNLSKDGLPLSVARRLATTAKK
jgi:hypothetical protein